MEKCCSPRSPSTLAAHRPAGRPPFGRSSPPGTRVAPCRTSACTLGRAQLQPSSSRPGNPLHSCMRLPLAIGHPCMCSCSRHTSRPTGTARQTRSSPRTRRPSRRHQSTQRQRSTRHLGRFHRARTHGRCRTPWRRNLLARHMFGRRSRSARSPLKWERNGHSRTSLRRHKHCRRTRAHKYRRRTSRRRHRRCRRRRESTRSKRPRCRRLTALFGRANKPGTSLRWQIQPSWSTSARRLNRPARTDETVRGRARTRA